jgi:hypothetical protein
MTASSQSGARLRWIDFDKVPILFANHFAIQYQPDEFVLTLGQVTGQPIVGTPDEIAEQARALGGAEIHTIGRIGLARHRLVELIDILQATLRDHDRIVGPTS